MGSSPLVSTKKEVTFVYQKLLLFLSKPQAWHIITRQRVYHRRRRISSAEGCITCGLMRCKSNVNTIAIKNSYDLAPVQDYILKNETLTQRDSFLRLTRIKLVLKKTDISHKTKKSPCLQGLFFVSTNVDFDGYNRIF